MNKQDREKVRQAIQLLREVLEKEQPGPTTPIETQDDGGLGGTGGGPGEGPGPRP